VGIRDTSYYSWVTAYSIGNNFSTVISPHFSLYSDVIVTNSSSIYCSGYLSSSTLPHDESIISGVRDEIFAAAYDHAATKDKWFMFSSSDHGVSWGISEFFSASAFNHYCRAFSLDSSGNVYALGDVGFGTYYRIVTLKSANSGASWSVVDSYNPSGSTPAGQGFDINIRSTDNKIFTCGQINGVDSLWYIRSSSNGTTWGDCDIVDFSPSARKICFDSTGRIYVAGNGFIVRTSTVGSSGSWQTIHASGAFVNAGAIFYGITCDSLNNVYAVGTLQGRGIIRKASLVANSNSLGPQMLATSIGYVQNQISGVITEKFKLNNVSEFPHYGGLFQMKNMVLGSTYGGKVGTSEDSIIRVNHIGSVVRVMWPKQDSNLSLVKGLGDFSAGERIGKLSTEYQPGLSFNVSDSPGPYDHMSLFCYLVKHVSGTMDDVIITVERKPLKDNAFSIEQSIDYSVSGSKTEARLRDIEYKKQVDYGDLSIKEISFPIDIPLVNTKEVRISVRHANGQSEENKNFIVWGRFIKSEKNTEEI